MGGVTEPTVYDWLLAAWPLAAAVAGVIGMGIAHVLADRHHAAWIARVNARDD